MTISKKSFVAIMKMTMDSIDESYQYIMEHKELSFEDRKEILFGESIRKHMLYSYCAKTK